MKMKVHLIRVQRYFQYTISCPQHIYNKNKKSSHKIQFENCPSLLHEPFYLLKCKTEETHSKCYSFYV